MRPFLPSSRRAQRACEARRVLRNRRSKMGRGAKPRFGPAARGLQNHGWKQIPRHLAFGALRLTEPRSGAVRGCARFFRHQGIRSVPAREKIKLYPLERVLGEKGVKPVLRILELTGDFIGSILYCYLADKKAGPACAGPLGVKLRISVSEFGADKTAGC